jgi:hypothetical protein
MSFVRDNALLPYLLSRLGLDADAERLFLRRLELIHRAMKCIAEKTQKKT